MEENFMRVLVMFDMPTGTKLERKASAKFRQRLLKEGFFMMQFSVYCRICKGIASANSYMNKIESFVPQKGHVRALILTEKQFDRMRIFVGYKSATEEAQAPVQLSVL
ncbi:CRISPR-associated endonuclease Cas2 [Helicobacter sp. faydin-H20]|uniref:CRISPR-associated endonuclease Cas2 n=1 Tax=Helicobacter anatolicus TaxID=2905874 RepID=UPI001E62742F|nr:CRISPR-associated endonuclease Cas2 [Helicobacter anatolicus]MCE3036835.1 CRISPR-associated endonuclease Cas2 [Helicobacter anatolicus]